jgi:hypothetical protein
MGFDWFFAVLGELGALPQHGVCRVTGPPLGVRGEMGFRFECEGFMKKKAVVLVSGGLDSTTCSGQSSMIYWRL